MLKKIGKVGGKDHPRKSINRNPTTNDDMFWFFIYAIVAKYIIIATPNASSRKNKALLKISELPGTLVKIFLIILPLLVVYPVFTTSARTFPFF